MGRVGSVRLFSSGLLSKWGFNDGDAPDDWLDWIEQQGIDWRIGGNWRDGILPALVRRYLVPELDQDVTLVDISTNHNPIRAGTVDGINVEDWWYENGDGEPRLTPEYVEVPYEEVLKFAGHLEQAPA
jgi:hypothetical protein